MILTWSSIFKLHQPSVSKWNYAHLASKAFNGLCIIGNIVSFLCAYFHGHYSYAFEPWKQPYFTFGFRFYAGRGNLQDESRVQVNY